MKFCVYLFILLLLHTQCLAEEGKAIFSKAEINFEAGRFEDAVRLYREYLDFWPQTKDAPKAQFREAESLFQLNRFAEAIEAYRKNVNLYPTSDYAKKALLRIGDSYYRMGENEKACEAYSEVIKRYPDTKEKELAEYFIRKLKRTGAHSATEVSITKEELKELTQAKDLYAKGLYDEAFQAFLAFIERYPQSTYIPYAKLKLAECLYYQGKYGDAAIGYDELISLYPESKYAPYATYALSWSYYKLGKLNKAYNIISSFISMYPDSSYYESGLSLKEKIEEDMDRKKAERLFASAKELYQMGDLEKAQLVLESLQESYPDNPYREEAESILSEIKEMRAEKSLSKIKALYEEAEEHLKNREYDEAIKDFRKLLSDFPETEYSRLSRRAISVATQRKIDELAHSEWKEAEALYKEGKKREARIRFQKIISDFPTSKYADLSSKRLSEIVGEKEEREAEALYKEGLSLMKEESFTEAIERFNEVIIAFPTSDYTEPCKKKIAEAKERLKEKETARRFEIAMNYYKLGDHREAIARLQQIIASTPEGTYTEKARTMLKHLAEQKEEESAAEIFRTAQDYYERREYDKAFSWFKKVVDLYPQTRYAKSSVVIMAQINERLSNQKAKRIYDEAKEFQFKGKYNEAIKRLDHLLSEYPNSYWAPYAQYTKAEVWYEMGEYQEALFSWQRMEEVFSDSDLIPHSLYHIADCLIRLKRNREAAETYAKLLLSYPDSIYAKGEIRALIEERIERLKE